MIELKDLKDRICLFDNLLGAYRDAARNKRYRDEVLEFTKNLEENLFSIQADLLNMTYTVGPYREFYIQYPKPRLVMALGFRDRVVQWAIFRQLNPYADKRFITHSYGCRKGKGTLAAAKQLQSWLRLISRKPDADEYYILKGDIAKYFYRVDHEIVAALYAAYSSDPWFKWLMGTIIDNPTVPFGLPEGRSLTDCPREERLFTVGMPIGNLTSQETANMYLDVLDQHIKHDLHIHFYQRSMDDFVILMKGKENAEALLQHLSKFLAERLHLRISPKSKIIKATKGCEFVGLVVNAKGIRIRKRTVRHIKRTLRHIGTLYVQGKRPLKKCLQTRDSYIGMTKHKNARYLERWITENIVFRRDGKSGTVLQHS